MVQQWLCDRHSYVMSGKRLADFTHWVNNQPGGEAKVFSLHGIDVNFEMKDIESLELEVDVYPPADTSASQASTSTTGTTTAVATLPPRRRYQLLNNNNDPFLPDRMNLNFHREGSTGKEMHIDKYYHGNVHEWDQNPPTPLQLALRAVKLSFIFGPVITTSWLAMISKPFRRGIWYKWISNCLATSGAAFIKYVELFWFLKLNLDSASY